MQSLSNAGLARFGRLSGFAQPADAGHANEDTMGKRERLTTMMVLIAVAAAVTARGLVPIATAVPAQQASPPPVRAHVAAALPATIPIVPAPVIDGSAQLFIGTGDASDGAWVNR